MTAFAIWAAIYGGLLRLLYGGAPHVPDPADPAKQLPGFHKGPAYALFVVTGAIALLHRPVTWQGIAAALLVSLMLAAGWNPGHGSYLNPGNGSPDNETLIRPLVRFVAFGQPAGSVWYCCAGMGVRYGLQTAFTGLVMWNCNGWLGTSYGLWYAAAGLLACPVILLLWAIKWQRWAILPAWLGPQFNNGSFEAGVGALLYGSLALV